MPRSASARSRSMRLAAVATLVSSAAHFAPAQAAYSLTKAYQGDTFFDDWEFYGHYDNLTNGDIDYVNRTDSSDLAYINSAGNAIIKMDNVTDVLYPNKRRSVRIESTNLASLAFLHTSANAEGTLLYGNCDANVNFNSGCTYRDPRTSSYGAGLAAAGGGVYAAQLSTDGFSMWFFPRAEVPADLASTDFSTVPTPDSWGTPAAYYPASSCTPANHFSPLKMVFTATACGDWAGQPAVLSQTGCPLANDQMTCYTQYVLNSTNFDTAYFEVASVRAYTDPDRSAESSPQTTQTSSSEATSPSASATPQSGAARIGGGSVAGALAGVVAAGVMALASWALVTRADGDSRMSTTRDKHARKAAASRISYAEPASSSEDDGGDEQVKATRQAIKKRGKGKARVDDEASTDDDDDKPRNKARRASKRGQGKGKAQNDSEGKFSLLEVLPVELVVEVLSHLDPNDLLALTQVNKQYRAILTAKSSKPIWKSARKRLDLPSASKGDFTELQYAQLAFGKACQVSCGAKKGHNADWGIRQLSHNELKWRATAPYAFAADLNYYSDKLWELQYDETYSSEDGDGSNAPSAEMKDGESPETSSRGRPIRKAQRSVYVESLSDTEDDEGGLKSKLRSSRKVDAFVKERKAFLEPFAAVSDKVQKAQEQLKRTLRERQQTELSFSICNRVLGLNSDFEEADFLPEFYRDKRVVKAEPLTDSAWETIQPAIIKLVLRLRKKRLRDEHVVKLQQRQAALRKRYDKLKKALSVAMQPFVPLFVDFLVLPSVISLWDIEDDEASVEVTDDVWLEHLDAVKEEVEQHGLDLVCRAREIICAATTDPDERNERQQEDEIDLQEESADLDKFFRLATSFVCCAFSKCVSVGHDVASLVEVLQHQHRMHNGLSSLDAKSTLAPHEIEPALRIELPLEVACAVSAIVELADLDSSTACLSDLDSFTDGVHYLEWENTTSVRSRFYTWSSLVSHVRTEVHKAAKQKPPLSLDPPVIVLDPKCVYNWPPKVHESAAKKDWINSSSDSSDRSDSDDSSLKRSRAGPSACRPRQLPVVLDSEGENEDEEDGDAVPDEYNEDYDGHDNDEAEEDEHIFADQDEEDKPIVKAEAEDD
ncbi:hypothetical protein Rhopal_006529-T1 [Rhodotorula paludigena]|uniref:F-box domain-containing protein n=1 Tax=Rhodotorula paludigena TaxID=86838 RepID=A0AAV5GWR2_9BASI|nr:hypothetical protein Rhopal_006529-T1 [Rhodotorula paludigena]